MEVITKNKTVPNLRFKEFEGEWSEVKFGDLCKDVAYGMNASAIKFDGENQYLRITDIDEDSRKFIPKPLKSPDGEIEDKFILKKNDIVFTRTGASVGKSYLYDKNDGKLLYAGFLIKFNIAKANPYFIFSTTFRSKYNKWVKEYSVRSGQPGLNAEEYKGMKLNIPQSEEQQKIATFLTSVDEKIQQLTKKVESLKVYKKGVMQKIFKQEIRFKADDGEEFEEWEEKKLGEIFERVTTKNKENNSNVLTISAQQGLINQQEYFNKSVSAKDVTGYYLLNRNDFAYNKSYSKGYPMGATKRLTKYDKGVVSTLYICFRMNTDNDLSFYEQYFDSGFLNHELSKIAQEGARNHGLLNVSVTEFFREIVIPNPILKEQTKIANYLSNIDEKISKVSKQLEEAKQFKKGLLQQMFV